MKYIVWLVLSTVASFGISLFFNDDTGKLVFTLLCFMFLCTLYIGDLIIDVAEKLSNNQKKIYALLDR